MSLVAQIVAAAPTTANVWDGMGAALSGPPGQPVEAGVMLAGLTQLTVQGDLGGVQAGCAAVSCRIRCHLADAAEINCSSVVTALAAA
jgi:hypothetical protein